MIEILEIFIKPLTFCQEFLISYKFKEKVIIIYSNFCAAKIKISKAQSNSNNLINSNN